MANYESSDDGGYSKYYADDTDDYGYSSNNDDNDDDDEQDNNAILELALEKLNIGPKKNKLIVFNLNGLLIHRAHTHNPSTIPKHRTPNGVYNSNRLVYKRDFLDEFMKFCLDRFEVGMWSSAQEHNVDGVLDCAFKGLKRRFLFVWDQGRCTNTGFKSLENTKKPLFLKELREVWSHFGNSNRGARFSESNTLLIHDDPCKALLNPPNTGIFPDSYDPDDEKDNALDPKKELGQYLEGLAKAEDVPSYVKQHSFGQPAIGPNHRNWDFYSRVIRRLKNN